MFLLFPFSLFFAKYPGNFTNRTSCKFSSITFSNNLGKKNKTSQSSRASNSMQLKYLENGMSVDIWKKVSPVNHCTTNYTPYRKQRTYQQVS